MNKNNPIVLKSNFSIGNLSAENDDEFLFDCFVNNSFYEEATRISSSKMILSGRTGSGKSAIVRTIENENHSSTEIELLNMTMNYIANSDVINFLLAFDADLDILFKTLWKHVICIELIRLVYKLKSEQESKKFVQRLWENLHSDQTKKRALNYLKTWESKFWVDMDENIRNITQSYEKKFAHDFGLEIEKFTGSAGYARTLSGEKKAQLQRRIRNIVNGDQLSELSKVLELLKSEIGTNRGNFYILFDRLDQNWADESIKYRLISSLFDILPSFRKIDNLKVVVGIRSDVLEKTLRENKSVDFQRDKFGDILQEIRWTRDQLYNLVDSRINHLFKRQYSTRDNIGFCDVFVNRVGEVNSFDYLLSRTLMRPRDILDYVNQCIVNSDGKQSVTADIIRKSEVEYSIIRLESIYDEWRNLYPSIEIILSNLKGIKKNLQFSEFLQSNVLEKVIEKLFDSYDTHDDEIYVAILNHVNNNDEQAKIIVGKRLVVMLYRVGVVGVKQSSQHAIQWSHTQQPIIEFEDLNPEFRFQIHDTFNAALSVNQK